MPGPLQGIRIIEVCHMLAGPFCGMILADLGAEVIKVEPPGGDIGRQIGPNTIGDHNVYFASLNRGKRSVCLDLSTGEGRRTFGRIAADAHGLVTNLRPQAIKKLGLTYPDMRRWNSQIACLALTGYGLEGPFSDRPAYDYVIQALTGLMAMTGDPGLPPTKSGFSVVDNSAGIMGAVALMAKICEGKGGQIEVSLHDVMLSQLNYVAAAYLNSGEKPVRQHGGAHPYIVPAQIFATRNGHLALFITHDDFWRRFAASAGKPEWVVDPKFATMVGRASNREVVIGAIGELLLTHDTDAWVDQLAPQGIVVAGVQSLDAALDGQLAMERNMITTIMTQNGALRLVANPIRFDGRDVTRYEEPPLLGEANTEFAEQLPTAS